MRNSYKDEKRLWQLLFIPSYKQLKSDNSQLVSCRAELLYGPLFSVEWTLLPPSSGAEQSRGLSVICNLTGLEESGVLSFRVLFWVMVKSIRILAGRKSPHHARRVHSVEIGADPAHLCFFPLFSSSFVSGVFCVSSIPTFIAWDGEHFCFFFSPMLGYSLGRTMPFIAI